MQYFNCSLCAYLLHYIRIIPVLYAPVLTNKINLKKNITTLSEQLQNQISKSIDSPNIQIHDRLVFRLGTGISIKSGGVKLAL